MFLGVNNLASGHLAVQVSVDPEEATQFSQLDVGAARAAMIQAMHALGNGDSIGAARGAAEALARIAIHSRYCGRIEVAP